MEPLGPGTSSAEVIAGRDDSSGLTALSDRFRAGRGPWWHRHHRGVVGSLVAVLVLVGAAGGWRLTHPPSLMIPAITVQVDPTSTPSHSTNSAAETGSTALLVPLLVKVTPVDGASVLFLGIRGTGITVTEPVAVPVRGADRTLAVSTVSCRDWEAGKTVVAAFDLDDGELRQQVEVPLSSGDAARIDGGVQDACWPWNDRNPITSEGVVTYLDPVDPVVHLDWAVSNAGRDEVTLDSLGTASDVMGPQPVLPGTVEGDVRVPAGGTASVRTSVRVMSCVNPSMMASAGQRLSLGGRTTEGTAWEGEVVLPEADTAAVFAAARSVCEGAPAVGDLSATASRAGDGAAARVILAIDGRLEGPGRWTATLVEPLWWVGDRTFPATTARVRGPGTFALGGTYASPTCPDLGSAYGSASLALTLSAGGRVYPFAASLRSSPAAGRGACGVSGR